MEVCIRQEHSALTRCVQWLLKWRKLQRNDEGAATAKRSLRDMLVPQRTHIINIHSVRRLVGHNRIHASHYRRSFSNLSFALARARQQTVLTRRPHASASNCNAKYESYD